MISKTQQLSNNRIAHYFEQGNGEPLVLIHGVGMQAEAWYPQIEYFSKHYRVISVDMPGHGQSTKLADDAQLQDFVNWAIEFITALNIGAVNLAGHSMGSLITTGVSATRPDLVKRMAVLNGVYKRTSEAKDAVIQRAEELKTGHIDIETPLQRWFGDREIERQAALKVKSWLENVDMSGYATAYSAFAKGDAIYADEWARIACPALILTGTGDPNSTAEMAVKMANQALHGKAVVIENERHMVNLTAPDQVNRAMQAWLETSI
ncbi:alpha/beta hydrolase [Acinetobacter sp. S40]|uniref:alpha/beta fold hydrolase n=1 Tax=unclassified Acinetobacter TaxID=196816 RepID=UPI00190C828E|nr:MULTISPECIES: alpha/beta hydrolase [unclassified Acinetobacter]MBJ9985280.1 alpha/beta hydrolase [Acinetobacter sp. S40]MBK0063842.1 alpha/beta hydrolase [Acinetobacter sp. S55]MBK0067090.1 alpha/beta hydrolase [Acinetobacter sp. S54]